MVRTKGSRSFRPLFVAVSLALLVVSVSDPARASWDGIQQIVVGDRVSATFESSPGMETHYFTFYAPDDTKLTLSWKTARGEALAVRVLDPDMVPLETASFIKGNRLKRLPLPTRGRHTIQVVATKGGGRYELKTSGKYPKRYGGKNIETPAEDDYEFEIGMPAGTRFKAKVKKGKGSGKPTFSSLEGPAGAVDLDPPNRASIKKLTIPSTGLFILKVAGGNGGKINLVVKPKFRVGKNPYRFDAMEVTPGTAEEIRTDWLASAHANLTAEAFAHWNNDSPAVVPQNCAKCHSGLGYRDFLGVLGNPLATPPETTATSNLNDPSPSPGQGQVASGPWPVGTPVNCDTCHNSVTQGLSEVTFPSGLTVTGLGDESRCMVCHQGRESTVSVENRISDAYTDTTDPISSDDEVTSKISFLNIHYFAAAGSLYGREAEAAYEYADPALSDLDPDPVTGLPARMSYDRRFAHVESKDVCFECHDQHSLKVRVTECATCHVTRNGDPIVTTEPTTTAAYEAAIENLHDVRMAGTINDFDGDGDTNEGVYYELTGLRDVLYGALRTYARAPKTNAAGTPIAYSPTSYPYFFVDNNDNGVVDAGETTRYNAWTARLLRAAYNYQYAQKDPGAFAHNAKYLIEILYDSIADLDAVATVAALANLVRNDSGHFDTSAEAYRHWDEDTDHLVDPSCARCHSAEGFLFRAKYGIDQTIPATLSSGMTCETCHETAANFSPLNGTPATRYIAEVTFPHPSTATSTQIADVTIENGTEGTAADDSSYLCMTCHQGRQSTLTVDAFDPGSMTSTFTKSFRNVHYLPAGGTLYGNRAAVAYQYTAKTYAPPWNHGIAYSGSYPQPVSEQAQCAFCHMQDGSHSFEPLVTAECTTLCHVDNPTIDNMTPAFRPEDDWDNNPATKPKAEVDVFAARLYAAIQAYCAAAADSMTPPAGASYTAYLGTQYPYWFKDTNKNGVVDAGETSSMKFDSKSLRASYNYQFYQKEPGAWAHHNAYIVQVLYDSIEDLGGDLTGLTRP
jgi:hypothetical protein